MRRNQGNKLKRKLGYEAVEERKAPTNLFPVEVDIPLGEEAQMSSYGDDDTVGGDDDTVGSGDNDTLPGSGG